MIRKSFIVLPGTTKVLDADKGIVEAWVNSTAVVDAQKDVMEPGCWADVTKAAAEGRTAYPSTVWGHDWNITTGKVLSAQEYAPGSLEIPDEIRELGAGSIKIRAQYNLETQRGREAFSDVKFGAIRQWSVGFLPDEAGLRYDAKGVRHIHRVLEWPEVSNVLMGASPGTMTASVKAGAAASDPAERKARAADRLERARALLAGLKDDGAGAKAAKEKPSKALCCDACKGAECTGCCDGCCRGEETAAKAGGGVPGDPPGVPYLEGDEAVHNGPLMQVLDGINTLIAQEIAEGGYTEYADIIRLCCLAQDAIRWAAGEQTEYGDYGLSIWDLFAAGRAALDSKTEPAQEEPAEKTVPALPAWLKAAILATSEADATSSHHPNPAHGGGDGLTWERRYVEGFSGFSRGLHAWLQQGVDGLQQAEGAPPAPPDDREPAGPPREWAERLTSPWHQQQ